MPAARCDPEYSPEAEAALTTHLTVEDLAARYQVPVSTIYTWNYRGLSPKRLSVGRHVRYRLEDVEAWEAERLVGGGDE